MIQENKDILLYSTRGTSMFPFIRGNEYILVKKVPIGEIQPGDTVVFESDAKAKICHRVVKIEEKNGILWFYTKGNKMESCDGSVREEKILGKVIAVKRKANLIELSANRIRSLLYKFGCVLSENIFFIKTILAKAPFLKKIYRYLSQK